MPATQIDRIDGLTTSVAVKAPVRVVSTSPISFVGTAPYGYQTIDGVAVTDNISTPDKFPDRVLLVGQTDQRQNGIWQVSSLAWTRALDFDGARDAVEGTMVYVNEGTNYKNSTWKLTTSNPIFIGTTALVFTLIFSAITSVVGGAVIFFDTTADLLTGIPAPVVLVDGQMLMTSGRTAKGDGGGAVFYYDASDTTTADNTGTIRVDTHSRRLKIPIDGTPLNALLFGGSDIGAQINAAYAGLPARGGAIRVPGGRFDFSTPIVFNTLGKYVRLESVGPGGADATSGTCLNYTPTNATVAVTLDCGQPIIGPPAPSWGLYGITLMNNAINTTGGGGSSATGILSGMTNGGDWNCTYDRVNVQGFGLGYSSLNLTAVDQTWINPQFLCNTTAMTVAQATQKHISGTYAANGRVFLAPAGTHPAELYFVEPNIFDNTHDPVFDCEANSPTNRVFLDFSQPHFENSPSLHTHYIQGNVNVTITGGLMEDDNASGTSDWMIKTDDFTMVTILGTTVAVARTLTAVVDMTHEVRAVLQMANLSPSLIANLAAGTFATEATMMPMLAYGTTPQPWQIRAPLILGDAFHPATPALGQQSAAAIFAGTGAPSNSNGANGDFYFRSDGGSMTTIYQKRAGSWAGIV